MDNIKEFKVNGTKYGLNLSEIGAVINDGGTQKELKTYIDSKSGSGGGTSSKVVRISKDWYNDVDNHQTEIKQAFDDIYNEVSNNRSVTVIFNGFGSQDENRVFETSNVVVQGKNDIIAYSFGWDRYFLQLRIIYDEDRNHFDFDIDVKEIAQKRNLYLPYVYTDGQINIDKNEGNIAEFISEPTVDNEEFVVIKTTVPSFKGTDIHRAYKTFYIDNEYWAIYLLSKFGGMKLSQDEYNSNYDLIPDGEWYVIFGDIQAATYSRIIVTKSVRNDDGTLDVYLGFKGIDIDSESTRFWDCTVENPEEQNNPDGDIWTQGLWSDKNWTKVSDAERISVDSFIGRRTRYFCTNTEGVKVDRLVLFKRMK